MAGIETHNPVLAVYSSGPSGSTFRAFAEAVYDGIVNVEIPLVISNTPNAGAFGHAAILNSTKGFDIRPALVNQEHFPKGHTERGQTRAEARAMLELCHKYGVTHLGLMGGLRVLHPMVIKEYGWLPEYSERDAEHRGVYFAHALNTHPAILPETADTYGIHAQERVISLGLRESAHTVHVVSEKPDEGPIVGETRFDILPGDTAESIFTRVQRIEKAMLPIIFQQFFVEQADFERSSALA